jgi:hypothetical protein
MTLLEIKTYFCGELGHLNLFILPRLNRIFLEKQDIKLTIYTFPDYCYIINNLFPMKFNLIEIPLNKMRLCSTAIDINNELIENKIPLIDIIGNSEKTIREIYEHYFPNYLTKCIDSNYYEDIDNFICLFPRYRDDKMYEDRNFSDNECKEIINKFNNYKIIIIGNEIVDYDYKKHSNIIISDSIEKTIFYLKHCKFLISKCSGLINLAQNCGTKLIFILNEGMIVNELFNPFNTLTFGITNLNIIDENMNLNNFNELIKNKLNNNIISLNDYKKFIIRHKLKRNITKNINEYINLYNLDLKFVWFTPIEKFKYNCYNYNKLIKFPINTPNITTKSMIIFITEKSQHIEFILRNNINKLGNDWSYYVFAFNNNFDYIKTICENINVDIIITKITLNYIIPNDVNLIFKYKIFINLISNEKILIMNEYTLLLNNYNNIFDNYDLVYSSSNYNFSYFPFLLTTKTNILNLQIDNNISLINNFINISKNIAPNEINNIFNLDYNEDYNNNFGSTNIFIREWYENIINDSLYNLII